MKKIVVLTGAGMSAESGISTFRDNNGLWEQYNVQDVASIEAWERNPQLMTHFYNQRRQQLTQVSPCLGHQLLAQIEQHAHITIITQNIDDLHERAGSHNIIHLHGELLKVTSSHSPNNPRYIRTLSKDHLQVHIGDKAADGSQLRPFIVWFGEPVPRLQDAIDETTQADIFLVIGTSLNVYPAASLLDYVPATTPIYLIDPKNVHYAGHHPIHHIQCGASQGIQKFIQLMQKDGIM